ncbi:MAG TPA: tetratricopeptide repeat protein [Acidimicrobiales bacterium]|jgi:tetratricopeptide (TPR) repeat protein|nr:tetratricopeptide repeat protein [Acidimicrobiales bacterium]
MPLLTIAPWYRDLAAKAERLLTRTVEPDRLIQLERRLLSTSEVVLGDDSSLTRGARALLAESLDRDGQCSEALVVRSEGFDAKVRHHGAIHPDTIATELRIAGMFAAADRPGRAKRHLRHVIDHSRLRPDLDVSVTISAMYQLGRLYLAEDRPKKAQQMLESALIGYRSAFGEDRTETWRAASSLAVALARQEKYEAAIALLRQLSERQVSALDEDDPELVSTRWKLAEVLHGGGELSEAEALATGVLASKVRVYGYAGPETAAVRALLAGIFKSTERRKRSKKVLQRRDVGR